MLGSFNVRAIFQENPWSEGLLLAYLNDREFEDYMLPRI